MSILTKVIGSLSRKSDAISWTEGWADFLGGGARTYAGVSINRDDAMRVAAFHACVRLIALKLSSFPVDFYRRETTRRIPIPAPLWGLRPNREQLWPEFIAQAVVSVASQGEVFIDHSDRDSNGIIRALYVRDPQSVVVARDTQTNALSYTMNTSGGTVPLPRVAHWRLMAMPGSDRGLSPLECARQELGIARASQQYLATYFANGATVSAVLQFPAGVSKEEAAAYVAQFRELYASSENAHKVAGLVAAEYKPMALSNEQAQFLQLRSFSAIDIARLFNIHPTRIGEGLHTMMVGTSAEQYNLIVYQDAIQPYVSLFEAGFRDLLPNGQYLKFNVSSLLRGDTETRMKAYKALFDMGALSRDEIRAFEDMNPVPGGESYYLPTNNYSPLGPDGMPVPTTAPGA